MSVLIFDGDCAFCSSCVDLAARIVPSRIVMQPFQLADLSGLGIDVVACQAAVQYRDDFGRWHSGSEAVAMLLRESAGMWKFLGRILSLPGVRGVARIVYEWVARNRHRLPGGTPACQRLT